MHCDLLFISEKNDEEIVSMQDDHLLSKVIRMFPSLRDRHFVSSEKGVIFAKLKMTSPPLVKPSRSSQRRRGSLQLHDWSEWWLCSKSCSFIKIVRSELLKREVTKLLPLANITKHLRKCVTGDIYTVMAFFYGLRMDIEPGHVDEIQRIFSCENHSMTHLSVDLAE